jgi:hypothetical protein
MVFLPKSHTLSLTMRKHQRSPVEQYPKKYLILLKSHKKTLQNHQVIKHKKGWGNPVWKNLMRYEDKMWCCG